MKFIALTYDYDLGKLSQIGRKWSFDVYKNKNFIFDYSSASYATFIEKNPKQTLHIYTDDIDMMQSKMNEYKERQSSLAADAMAGLQGKNNTFGVLGGKKSRKSKKSRRSKRRSRRSRTYSKRR